MKLRLSHCQSVLILLFMVGCLVTGCSDGAQEFKIKGESCVLVKEEPTGLLFGSLEKPVMVRSTFSNEPGSVMYEEGRDYEVNYAKGTIRRLSGSRIPDYAGHVMYGKEGFNQDDYGDFAAWSNNKYFVYIDYTTTSYQRLAESNDQSGVLPRFSKRLRSGEKVRITWYGDSITAGCEASQPDRAFASLYEHYLKEKFPAAILESNNVSVPGYGTKEALAGFLSNFDTLHPDVVFLGFGMNDHNKIGCEPAVFQANLDSLVLAIKRKFDADVVIFSSFPPNDHWYQSTHRMDQFAEASKQVAADTRSAYVDVYDTWMKVFKRKDQSSLLANNINHPNDFGHWVYEQAFEAMYF